MSLQVSSLSNISGLVNRSWCFPVHTSLRFSTSPALVPHTFLAFNALTWSFREQLMGLRQPLCEMHLVAGFWACQRPVAHNSSRRTCCYLLEGSQTRLCLWQNAWLPCIDVGEGASSPYAMLAEPSPTSPFPYPFHVLSVLCNFY